MWIVSHVQVIDDGSTDADTRPEPPTDFRLACKLEKVDHARRVCPIHGLPGPREERSKEALDSVISQFIFRSTFNRRSRQSTHYEDTYPVPLNLGFLR